MGDRFVVTKGLDNCLFVYGMEEWKELEQRAKSLSLSKARSLQRFLFAGAAELEADKQGRVLLPQNLRDYANIQKDVMIVGVSTRVEIWDKALWEERSQVSEEDLDAIAERMESIGIRI